MIFRKFHLHAGKIARSPDLNAVYTEAHLEVQEEYIRELLTESLAHYQTTTSSEIDTDTFNPDWLNLSNEYLSQLQKGPAGVTLVSPDESNLAPMIVCLGDDLGEGRNRDSQFYITDEFNRVRGIYYIFPTENADRSLLEEAVATSYVRSRISDGHTQYLSDDELKARLAAVADEIWDARPALVCAELGFPITDKFVDYLAAAMLM